MFSVEDYFFYLQKRQLKMCQFVEDIVTSLETLRMTQVLFGRFMKLG